MSDSRVEKIISVTPPIPDSKIDTKGFLRFSFDINQFGDGSVAGRLQNFIEFSDAKLLVN